MPMKHVLMSRFAMLLLLLPVFAGCGSSKKDDPTPTGSPQTIELRANYSGMKYLGGTFTAFNVTNGAPTIITEVYLPTANSGAGTNDNVGTITKSLGTFPAGTKIRVLVEMTEVKNAADAASLNPRSTTPRPPNVYPKYLDVDIVADGKVVKTVALDGATPMDWQSKANLQTEYTYQL